MRSIGLLFITLGLISLISCNKKKEIEIDFKNIDEYKVGKDVCEHPDWIDIQNGVCITNTDKGIQFSKSENAEYSTIKYAKPIVAKSIGDAVTVSINFTFDQVVFRKKGEIIRLGLSNGESEIMALMDRTNFGDYHFIGIDDYPHGETFHIGEFGLANDAVQGTTEQFQLAMTLTKVSESTWDLMLVLKNLDNEDICPKYWGSTGLKFKKGNGSELYGIIQNGIADSKIGLKNRTIQQFAINSNSAPNNPFELKTEKSLKDFFLPMEPQTALVSDGIWGVDNVLPRDTANGLEDAKLENWCYWDGRTVKDDEGKYHIYASRWSQACSHSDGWKIDSKGIHAVSDNIMGPYKDKGVLWPQWQNGKGSNVIGLRMHDGRYACVTSEITYGEIFVSDTPYGPWKFHGKITYDLNGFDPGIAAYNGGKGNMSNVKIIRRPEGGYMLVPRSTCTMISEDDIRGPYKIVNGRVYDDYPQLPKGRNEDPAVWYSGGMYHILYNHWPSKTCHHFTSKDGIEAWKYRGVAFKKGETPIFTYTDGTVNEWEFIERPTAHVENGHVTHFIFSVLDVHKGRDQANDNHASKIVVVPFDGVSFDKYLNELDSSLN